MVIGDGKALAKAVRNVYGSCAIVQRCQTHKVRNDVQQTAGHRPSLGYQCRVQGQEMKSTKLIELEAVRGIAAVLVLVHHLLLGFFPRSHGLLFPDEPYALFGTPLFAFINGSAAVVLFFVLSGFVLTVRAQASHSVRPLILSAMRRWPRLLVPVLCVNLVSGLLAGWGYYHNVPVSVAVGSPWLGWFFAQPPAEWTTFLAAAREGTVTTFLNGENYFNSSLWTMFYEFYGSFLAFCAAAAIILTARRYALIVLSLGTFAVALLNPYFVTFVAGMALATFYTSSHWQSFTQWISRRGRLSGALLVCGIIVMLGYHEAFAPSANPLGLYAPLLPVFRVFPLGLRVLLHTAAAVLVLLSALSIPSVGQRLRGRAGSFVGRLSFPLYLVQVPVICSVGSATHELVFPLWGGAGARLAAFAASGLASIVAALPIMWLESKWLFRISVWFGPGTWVTKLPRHMGGSR